MKRLAVSAVVLAGLCVLPARGTRAAELLVLDWNPRTVTKGDHGFPTSSSGFDNSDWTQPIDYAHGTLYHRLELRSMPVAKRMNWQFCFHQNGITLENCGSQSAYFTGPTSGPPVVVTYTSSIQSMWKLNGIPIDWSQPRSKVFGVIRKSSNEYISDYSSLNGGNAWAGENPDDWYPMEIRFTVVVVSKGGTFSGWDTYIGGGTVTEPGVSTNDASNVAADSARLNGEITSTGGENPTVRIYWGDNDGGTNSGSWDHTETLGIRGAGAFYEDVTGLSGGTTYYFRCFASNSAGGTWASATKSFATPGVQKPTVVTRPASSVRATSARLNGEVTSTGGENPTVRVYWGTTDGGTTAASWDGFEDLGMRPAGTFYEDVAGLTEGQTYHFRCFASNSAGGSWASSSQSFTAAAPVGGLVGHWKFDDGSGTTAVDSSAKGNDGTVHGSTWTTGKIGGALSFDGTDNDYVEIPNETDYDLADAVSYSVWVKANPSSTISWMGVITKGDHMNLQRYGVENYVTWQTRDCPDTISNYQLDGKAAVLDGQWHHIAATYDGSQKCIYTDGVLDNSVAAAGTINTSDYKIMIARNGFEPGDGFAGIIDDARIYDYALSPAEVQTLYEMGSGGPQEGPTITQHPQDVTVTEGDPATFTVAATGTGTLHHQWYENGAEAGADTATYAISSAQLSQDGHKFHCVVTDDNGSATSSSATLRVNAGQAPTITQHPLSVTVTEGDPATFTVAATGTGTLHYQWYEESAKVGSDSPSYFVSSTQFSQNGHGFHCVVTDDAGSATSSSATLTVNPAPVDTDQDGLPDSWEDLYGLDPTKADTDGDGTLDPNGDLDQDGYTNLEEFQHGTVPTDPNSFPNEGGATTFCVAGRLGLSPWAGVAVFVLIAAFLSVCSRRCAETARARSGG